MKLFRSESKSKPKSKSSDHSDGRRSKNIYLTDSTSGGSSHSSSTSVLPSRAATELEEAFKLMDKDHDGKISRSELTHVLVSTGIITSRERTLSEAEAMMRVLDVDGDGCVSLDEFMAIKSEDDDEDEELREVFRVFDVNGDGRISAEELYQVLSAMEEGRCTVEECRRMIGCVDGDGDGFVGFEDFKIMMIGRRDQSSKMLVV
ncbi:putative calcium-binding protein CML10 [Drosera capensis]